MCYTNAALAFEMINFNKVKKMVEKHDEERN
jgi:hypothetical protein